MIASLKSLRRLRLLYRGIAKKIITATILFSSIITLFITGFNLYGRYTYEISQIDSKFNEIKEVHLSSLTNNLWLADKHELQVQLKGILHIPEIQYVEVYDNNSLWASAGEKKEDNIKVHSYPMIYVYKNKTVDIGSIKIVASLDNVYHNIYQELWVTLAANAIKTFLVAFFMLYIFYKLVIQHMHAIAGYLLSFDINANSEKLALVRAKGPGTDNDELDMVVSAFNELQDKLKQSFSSVEKEVEQRTKELMHAKEEAVHASNSKSEFLSRMSHELRTPMNAILGFGQLLQLDSSLADDHKGFVEEVMRAGYHLLTLINEVLDLAKIEEGKFDVHIETTDVSKTITEAMSLLMPLAQQRHITIHDNVSDEISYFVKADNLRLKQVIINLLSNAIKYNSDRGKVYIDISKPDTEILRVSIRDTGQGIALNKLDKLFIPFERLGNSHNLVVEGAGIGLALSKRLIELMHGKIGVDSKPKQGCTFYFDLPYVREETTAAYNVSKISGQSKPIDRHVHLHKVLYVEDNPSNLRLVEHALQVRPDITLITAHTGTLGLDMAISYRPDLILLDINLPGINGMEIVHELMKHDSTSTIPVIAVTAHAMPRDIEAGKAAGFDEYLIKPLDVDNFYTVLKKYLP